MTAMAVAMAGRRTDGRRAVLATPPRLTEASTPLTLAPLIASGGAAWPRAVCAREARRAETRAVGAVAMWLLASHSGARTRGR